MANQFDEIDTDALDDAQDSSAMRWVSGLVIVIAVLGFFMLAWYAYHTGMQQTANTDTIDVVKADGEPAKEAPADPGGQQFPHQDKTVYNLVSGNPEPKTAERIMPPPEEPVNRGDTETWMNKKLYPNGEKPTESAAEAKPEEKTEAAAPEAAPVVEPKPAPKPTPPAEIFKAHHNAVEKPEVPEAPVADKVEKPEPVPAKPVEAAKPEPKPVVAAVKPTPKPVVKGGSILQLGAFKSEAEAKAQWEKIKSRNSGLIADKEPNFVRADLGAKGVYYRIWLTDFAGAKEAKSLCSALSARKQPCILVPGK